MRYILINDLFTKGGTEVQSKRELEYFQKMGHEVLYITFDPNLAYHESKCKGHLNLSKNKNGLNRYFCNSKALKELKKVINEFMPDFIHINNSYLYAPTVYKAVKDYFCIQTIRDYAYVCPKSTCIFPDCSICKGMNYENCVKKCLPHNPKDFLVFCTKYVILKKNRKLQKNSINKFICPSQKLTDYCNANGYDTDCVNNPFDFNLMKSLKKDESNKKKIYLYYGMVAKIKGVLQLIDAFKEFSKDKDDVELHIVGGFKELNESELKCDEKIKYLGKLPYDKMLEKLQSVYSVVVPSLWMENYPNTVLEGFATDCVVLGSNRGGMVEQIGDENRIFDVLNQKDIIRVLNYSYTLSNEKKDEILKTQHRYMDEHNTQEKYYEKLISELKGVSLSD